MFNSQETVDLLYLRKFIYHKKAINNNKYQDTFIKVIFVRVIIMIFEYLEIDRYVAFILYVHISNNNLSKK